MWDRDKLIALGVKFAVDLGTGRDAPCWIWPGWEPEHRRHRYAQVNIAGKNLRAHRAMYEALLGPIPAGLILDHLCLTKACVNPDHLEPVTVKVNNERAVAAGLRPKTYKTYKKRRQSRFR